MALDAVIEQKPGRGGGGGSFSQRRLSRFRKSSAATTGLVAPPQSPKKLAKVLQTLLLRFPLARASMNEVLAEFGLTWSAPPRRSAPGVLDKLNKRWKDVTAGTAV